MTPVTTWAAIRTGQAALIRGLTPSLHARDRFIEGEYSHDFDQWVQDNAAAAFRRFEVTVSPSYEPSEVWSREVRSENDGTLIRVAYPHLHARYGALSAADMHGLMDADRRKITDTLEDPDNYVSGCLRQAVDEWTPLKLETVTIMELNIGLIYYRSNAS